MKNLLYITLLMLTFNAFSLQAQVERDTLISIHKRDRIENLIRMKEDVVKQEKDRLKEIIREIDEQQRNGDISAAEAQSRKEEAAKNAALNIENKTAIIDNRIALIRRGEDYKIRRDGSYISIGIDDDIISVGVDDELYELSSDMLDFDHIFSKRRRYDRRTYSDLVVAFGMNNTIQEDGSINDNPYKVGRSRFFELGLAWTTRVFENSNAVRFKYGFSFQFNGLFADNNLYFVRNGLQTDLEAFPDEIRKAKLRMDNLVVPLHFEFGPSRKIIRDDYFRYSTKKAFKLGVGGYAGLNVGTRQKLKYTVDGERKKEKIKSDYNTNDFIYGLSGYIGVGDFAFYVKYDLNPVFTHNDFKENNISFGLRFDL